MRHAASVLVWATVCVALSEGLHDSPLRIGPLKIGPLKIGVQAQSLGDLARKEEERRKAVTPGKVYTNDSLRSRPAPPPPPAATAPAEVGPPSQPQAEQAGGATPPADTLKKDEAYWRARLKAERDAVERSKVLVDALQSRVNALQTDFVNRDDPAARAGVAVERQRALSELDRTRLEIQQRTKAIADIQEEARRSGVPAGWYR